MTPQPAFVPTGTPMSEPARLSGVYFSPGQTMVDVVARPRRWWLPMLLLIAAQMIFYTFFGQRVGWERMVRAQMEGSSRMEQIPPEKREEAIERGAKFAAPITYAGVALAIPAVGFAVAGILMFVMNAMGAKSSYIQSLAIWAYTGMIAVLTTLLAIGVMFLKNPEDFDLRNPLAFNVGAFLSSTSPKWLTALGSSLDVFSFWSMAVLAFGFGATSKKMTWGKAFAGVFALWAVYLLCKVGWVSMFG